MRAVDVTFLRWPAEADRRERLRAEGRPRLLLVDGGEPAPAPSDDLEDWARLPADDADLEVRRQTLTHRATARWAPLPDLDGDGVLRLGGAWVALPPVEARLTGALLTRWGQVVSREALAGAGWPQGAPGRNALDVHVLRLRRRLAPLALAIRTVRSRGYLIETAAPAAGTASLVVAAAASLPTVDA